MSSNGILFTITILISLVYRSSAIYCYYCNSANNTACVDPKQYDDELRARYVPVINCETAVPPVSEYNFFCRKIEQIIYHPHKESELRVTRGCGWVQHHQPCYRADNQDHKETVCQCFTDHCNSADSLSSPTNMALFLAYIVYLYLR